MFMFIGITAGYDMKVGAADVDILFHNLTSFLFTHILALMPSNWSKLAFFRYLCLIIPPRLDLCSIIYYTFRGKVGVAKVDTLKFLGHRMTYLYSS